MISPHCTPAVKGNTQDLPSFNRICRSSLSERSVFICICNLSSSRWSFSDETCVAVRPHHIRASAPIRSIQVAVRIMLQALIHTMVGGLDVSIVRRRVFSFSSVCRSRMISSLCKQTQTRTRIQLKMFSSDIKASACSAARTPFLVWKKKYQTTVRTNVPLFLSALDGSQQFGV